MFFGIGIFPFDHPRILIEPFRCASFLVRHTFRLIADVSQATDFGAPLASDPEHPAASDQGDLTLRLTSEPLAITHDVTRNGMA